MPKQGTYDQSEVQRFLSRDLYRAAVPPTADNDRVDTAALGRTFSIGNRWIDTVGAKVYTCIDDTATAAVWV